MSQAETKVSQPAMNINMNMGIGGPGGMNGGSGPRPGPSANERVLLHTYIYDYFLKNDMIESARSLINEADVQTVSNDGSRRPSPARRSQKHDADGNIVNGIDDIALDNGEGSQRKTEDGEDGAKRGDDLPRAKVPADCPQGSFLLDWWCLFWDIFGARNGTGKSAQASLYVAQTQTAQRMRQEQLIRQMAPHQQQTLMNGPVPSQLMNAPGYSNRIIQTGMMPNNVMHVPDNSGGMDAAQQHKNLVRTAMLNNNSRKTPQQVAALKNQQMIQQVMQRDGEVGEMNGQQPRPQSPATGQNAGSPGTKRIRLENGEYQPVGNGRGAQQGVPPGSASQTHQLLMANGINPNHLTAQQFAAFQGQNPITQHKYLQQYAQSVAAHTGRAVSALQQGGPISKGMPNMAQNPPNHGSPMLPQTTEGTTIGDYYANPGMRGGMNPGTGNHALQDYQMQLMLLEQQNKKRLMMARAEQDNLAQHGDNQRRMDQAFSQSMSPGSRAAPSPQPTGNPKMGGTPKMQNQVGPGSPLPDGQMSAGVPQRGSPASMGAFNGQMPDPHQNLMYQMKDMAMMGGTQGGGASNGAMMPPRPNSHPAFNGQMSQADMSQMNQQMRGQQAGRGGPQAMSSAWQQQQAQVQAQAHVQAQQQQQQQQQLQMHQVQQQQQQQQQSGGPQPPQVGTPQQARQSLTHQAMPPPSAPAAGATNNGRTQPSPPQVRDQPATPTQSHKAPPKTKGARDTGKKQRPTKKSAGAAPPAPGSGAPPSEPQTPTEPHQNSFTQSASHTRPTGFTAGTPSGNNSSQAAQQNATNPAPAAPPAPVAAPDPIAAAPFPNLTEDLINFEFADNPTDIGLDNFDFDSFLNTEDSTSIGFDNAMGQWNTDPVEAGPGES